MIRLLSLLGVLAGLAVVSAQDAKPPTAKDIMTRLNKGPDSLCPTLGKALKAETAKIDWEAADKEAKEFVQLAAALQKVRPGKGDQASWDKLTDAYAKKVQALEMAVEKKDPKAALEAHKYLANMQTCTACHNAHR